MSDVISKSSEEFESLQHRFTDFLKTFKDDEGNFKYEYRIKEMIVNGKRSIVVDYEDLAKYDPKLLEEIINRPDEALHAFSESIKAVVYEFDEEYARSADRFTPRLNGLPISYTLREISSEHINKLVMIEGILVKATPPKQRLFKAIYLHVLPTGESHEFEWPPLPGEELGDELERPSYCPICVKEELVGERGRASGRGTYKLVVEKSKYRSWQKIVIQERPEEVPAGHIPRSIEAVLTDDIVDVARPGDRIAVIGIVKLYKEFRRSQSTLFNAYIDVNNIIVAQRFLEEVKLSREDEEVIKRLSKDPLIRRKIIASIAPTIHGLWDIKEAIALQLFGGIPKIAPDGTKIRGDIHVLIVGDPGTAKSQLLQYVSRIAPRGLYTTGKGSSAAGLCVGGDTLVYTGNGLVSIRELVDKNLNGFKIFEGALISMMPKAVDIVAYNGGVGISKSSKYYMLWSDELIEIRSELGIDLIVTPETKVLVLEDGAIRWRHAKDIDEGSYLVTIRRIPKISDKLSIVDLLPGNAYLRINRKLTRLIIESIVRRFNSLSDFVRASNISYWDLYILRRDSVIKLEVLNKLLEFIGLSSIELNNYIECVGFRGSRGIIKWLSINVNDDFIRLLARLYINGYIRLGRDGKPSRTIYFTKSVSDLMVFTEILNNLFKWSIKYRIIPRSYGYLVIIDNKLLASIFHNLGVRLIGTDSMRLNGILFKLPMELLETLIKEIYIVNGGLREDHICISLPNRYCALQLIMLLRLFGVVAELHEGFKYYEVRIYDRKSIKNLEDVLGKLIQTKLMNSSGDRYIEVNGDLIAVKVLDVFKTRGDNVYDLTVDGSHSFVANGFIVHNTAAVVKDKQTGEYFLEAGAMVLADGGTVCIDEIDKMRDEDRVAIHEAMEQGTVSIAKAGIVARLNARASVLAAGNPKYGRYIPSRAISENINLPITILSRFDLIFTLRDIADMERDKSLVRYVLRSHERIEEVKPEIPPDILRKYIAYARKYVRPRLTKEAELLIEQFYLEMRKKSIETPESPIAITTRQLEALIRLAEAHARMALKNYVEAEDAAEAIRLMSVMLENVGLDIETGNIDIDVIMTGKPKSVRDKELIIKDIIKELSSSEGCAKVKEIVKEAVKRGIEEEFVERYITNLRRIGEVYEVRSGCINFIE